MDYNYMIIYKKYNGDLLYRSVQGMPRYKKGERTSMGWTVMDIQKMYKGKLYSISEFDNKLSKRTTLSSFIKTITRIDYATLLKLLIIGVVLYIIYVKF